MRVHPVIRGAPQARQLVAQPVGLTFARPLAQYAVRTPSAEKTGGYYYAVLFTSRTERTMRGARGGLRRQSWHGGRFKER